MHRYPGIIRAAVKLLLARLGVVLIAICLNGCSRNEPVETPIRRAVKIEAVSETVGSGGSFTGIVRPRRRAELAFESSGRLTSLGVEIGDRVQKGQVLATLDDTPAQQRLLQARASAEASRAQRAERESNYQRQQRLYAGGSVAQSVVEAARAAHEEAVSQQRRSASELVLAQRDVEKGHLVAPFTGRIVARHADAYAQLTQGQIVLELESADDRQVVAAVPTIQAERLKTGDIAQAYLASQPLATFDLVLEAVSSRAENGLLQTCIFRLRDPSVNLASGVTVLVQLKAAIEKHLSVPTSALSMGTTPSTARVFVYEPGQGRVSLRNVSITGVTDGRALIASGLVKGESVVTAGVAFLSDGQAVSLYQPLTRLAQD